MGKVQVQLRADCTCHGNVVIANDVTAFDHTLNSDAAALLRHLPPLIEEYKEAESAIIPPPPF
jgi:hypothetical protein